MVLFQSMFDNRVFVLSYGTHMRHPGDTRKYDALRIILFRFCIRLTNC